MDLWNERNLKMPPINRTKCILKDADVKLLKSILWESAEFFSNQKHFYLEAALLSRTMYRMKMKFRSSKDFHSLEKINRSLRNYLQVNIVSVLRTISSLLPKSWEKEKYFPTKNLIHFALVRLQGLGMLLKSLNETCKSSCELYRKRMNLGHFWNLAIIIFGILSRIFVVGLKMLKIACDLYRDLLPYARKIPDGSVKWLPEDYTFPESLNEWLQVDLDDGIVDITEEDECEIVNAYFNLVDSDDEIDDKDVELFNEYVLVKDEDSVIVVEENERSTNELYGFEDNEDVGEVVIEDSEDNTVVDLTSPKKPPKKKKVKKHSNYKANNNNFRGTKRKISFSQTKNKKRKSN